MNIILNRELLSTDVRDCLLGSVLWCTVEYSIILDIASSVLG